MKIRHWLFFCCLLPQWAATQVVTFSEDIQLRNDVAYEVIGRFKDRLLLFRDQTTKFEVQGFNDQMREIWSKELELDKRLPVVLGLAASEESFSVVYRFRRKSQTVVKAHKYDPAGNLLDSATVKDYGYLFYTPDFEIIRSQDRSKVIVYYVEKQSVVHATSFDLDSMRVLWDRTFNPEDFDFTRDLLHTALDNAGNFYLILEKNNLRYKKDPHYYEVHQFMGDNSRYTRYNVPLDGKLTYDVAFTFDNVNQALKAGGMYAENNPGRSTGYFYLSAPRESPQNYLLTFQAFEDDFIATLMGKETDDNKGIMECSVQEVVLRQDGGLIIVGERNRQYERRLAGTNRVVYDSYNRFIVDYFYDDLFLLSVHPDGRPHWKQVLHKKQYSQDDNGAFSSYFLFKTPRDLHFLFNDEIRQENTVSQYVINGHGEFERNSILSTANLRVRLRFRDAVQVSSRYVIIPSERRNALRLVMVEF